MTTGRVRRRDLRIYIDGYDMSGYTRTIGPLAVTFDEGMDETVTFNVKQTLLGMATVSAGTYNGMFDNTATVGSHAILQTAGVVRTLLVAQGVQAAPIANDPTFCGQFVQKDYYAAGDENPIAITIPFDNTGSGAGNLYYASPWGVLLHPNGAETAANTAVGLDQLAGTTKGGWLCYQVTAAAGAGNMTAALKVQHSTTTNLDGSFSDLLSTGTINCVAPVGSTVQLAPTATVGRYVRFQITLGTATSVTFALSFNRNYIP